MRVDAYLANSESFGRKNRGMSRQQRGESNGEPDTVEQACDFEDDEPPEGVDPMERFAPVIFDFLEPVKALHLSETCTPPRISRPPGCVRVRVIQEPSGPS